jgi:hypothetical protein
MYRGRTVLAMDCALAGAEKHLGQPLNSVVSCQVGLDTVELILSTEELFDISISARRRRRC